MPILWAVVDQQQDAGSRDTLAQHAEEGLRLAVQPMEIFEDEQERLLAALADQQPFNGFQRTSASNLRVHLLQGGDRLGDSQQRKQIRQRIFQSAIQDQYFAGHLLLDFTLVVLEGELE